MTGADTVEQLPEGGWQVTQQLTPSVTRYVGHNVQAAKFVCAAMGEAVPDQYYTVAFEGPDKSVRLFLFTRDARRPSSALMLSYEAGQLPLSIGILKTIYVGMFTDAGMSEIITQVPASAVEHREALVRLGFAYAGREIQPGGDRILYALSTAALPLSFQRAIRRRSN